MPGYPCFFHAYEVPEFTRSTYFRRGLLLHRMSSRDVLCFLRRVISALVIPVWVLAVSLQMEEEFCIIVEAQHSMHSIRPQHNNTLLLVQQHLCCL